jgi:hypothetical protein
VTAVHRAQPDRAESISTSGSNITATHLTGYSGPNPDAIPEKVEVKAVINLVAGLLKIIIKVILYVVC